MKTVNEIAADCGIEALSNMIDRILADSYKANNGLEEVYQDIVKAFYRRIEVLEKVEERVAALERRLPELEEGIQEVQRRQIKSKPGS